MVSSTPALDWLTAFVVNTRATRLRVSLRLFAAIQGEMYLPPVPNDDARYEFAGVPVEFK